jgi:hypothetical protein
VGRERPLEGLGGEQTAEAAAGDDDVPGDWFESRVEKV